MPVTPAMEPASHPAVRARILCTAKKGFPTPTPSRRSATKRLNQRRRARASALRDVAPVTPSVARVPSPYHQPLPSSLYVFDHDFYNNEVIMNSDVSFEDAVFRAETNRQAKSLHKAYKAIIKSSQLDDEFEPMEMPNPPWLMRLWLADDYDILHPETFFGMFIRDEQIDILVQITNAYTAYQLTNHPKKHKGKKHWKSTNQQEMKIYLAVLLFMGI